MNSPFKKYHWYFSQKGQSLIEMIAALAVVMIVILSLVTITTVSMRNVGFSRNQALATKYASEGIEKVRAYRDQNTWQIFSQNCETVLNSSPVPTPFLRSLNCYTSNPPPEVECSASADRCLVRVVVSWADSQGTHQSELVTRFTNWK